MRSIKAASVWLAALTISLAVAGGCHAWPPLGVVYGNAHGGGNQPGPLAVTLAPGSPPTASVTFSTSGTYTTNAVTATATGGHQPYSYAWTRVSGSAVPSANTPSAASTTWTGTVVAGTNYNPVWKVTVTDNNAATAAATANVNFTPTGNFPLNLLARGMVADDVTQTVITVGGGPSPNFTKTASTSYCTLNSSMVCTASADFDNMANAGITYIRIPTDVQQVLPNLPFVTSYLQVLTGTGTYNAGTGAVVITPDRATNLGVGDKVPVSPTGTCTYSPTATANFNGTNQITVSSVTGASNTSSITDVTTPSAIPAGATITNSVSATKTLTLSKTVTGMLNGDTLAITNTGCLKDLTGLFTLAAGSTSSSFKFTIPTDGAAITLTKVTFQVTPDTNGNNIYAPLASTITRSSGNPTGCAETYVSTTCTVAWTLSYLDAIIAAATDPSRGIAVDVVPFPVNGIVPSTNQMVSGFSNTNTTGDLHHDMGAGIVCYGYSVMTNATCFEQMLLQTSTTLVARYASYSASQYFQELSNEPDYKTAIPLVNSWQNPRFWNIGRRAIVAAIRSTDTTHWIIDAGVSASKAQYLHALTPTNDSKTVYAFHKYDPIWTVDQDQIGVKVNPYTLYPREGTGEPAIGRPSGIAAPGMSNPQPVLNTPAGWNTTVSMTGCTPTAWTPGGAVTNSGQKVACVNGTSFDYFKNAGGQNAEITKSELLSDPSPGVTGSNNTGIQLAVDWAVDGGHGIGISGLSWSSGTATATMYDDPTVYIHVGDTITIVGACASTTCTSSWNGSFSVTGVTSTTVTFAVASNPGSFSFGPSHARMTDGSIFAGANKIIVGEIGFTHYADYRSRIQFLLDLRSLLESTNVPGGQNGIGWDYWAYAGREYGVKPKGGGVQSPTEHYCLGTIGGVAGYDLDDWAILSTPQANANGSAYTAPNCTASTRADFGTPGLP